MLLKSVVVFVTLFAFSLASDVLELGDDDFNTRLAETETTLVMFYAPWYVIILFPIAGDKIGFLSFPVLFIVCLFILLVK